MIKSIFGHFPKHLLHRYSHRTLGLVHSFCHKKGLLSQKQSLEFAKKKEIVDELKQTSKQKEMGKEIKQPQNEKQYNVRELKKQINKSKNFIERIFVIIAVVGIYYAYKSFQVKYQATNKYKWALARQQHSKDFVQNKTFVHGKSVENKIRSIFEQNCNSLELIFGVEGIGKSLAVKKLITEKREKAKKEKRKERIYFIDLRRSQKSNNNDTTKNSQKMSKLIHAIDQQYDGSVPTTLVIDDINQLENIQNKLDRIQKQQQIISLSQRGVKVILISSSTSFYHNIWIKERFRKCTNKRQHIIWMMSEQQSKQILQKKGQQLKIDKKIIQKVNSFGVPLRDSIALLEQIVDSKKQNVDNFLSYKKYCFQSHIKNILSDSIENKQFNLKASYEFISIITKNNMYENVSKASAQNCGKLYDQGQKKWGSRNMVTRAIQQLDKGNLIIMCYPRSRLVMKVFQEKVEELEKKLEKK